MVADGSQMDGLEWLEVKQKALKNLIPETRDVSEMHFYQLYHVLSICFSFRNTVNRPVFPRPGTLRCAPWSASGSCRPSTRWWDRCSASWSP